MKIIFYILITISTTQITFAQESSLGSSKKIFNNYFTTIEEAVTKSFPNFKPRLLQQQLRTTYKNSLRHPTGHTISSYKKLQSMFKFPTRIVRQSVDYVQSVKQIDKNPAFTYGINKNQGKAFVQMNVDKTPLMSSTAANKIIPRISKLHINKLKQYGINQSELIFQETSLFYIQAGNKNGEIQEKLADSFVTYGLRRYGPFMVEGSFVKIQSKNPRVFESLQISWPKLLFHNQMRSFKIKSSKQLIQEITKRLKKSEQSRNAAINVRMAVVLRPVRLKLNSPIIFVPALKVGLYAKGGEAGNLIYHDLSTTQFKYLNEDTSDLQRSEIVNTP